MGRSSADGRRAVPLPKEGLGASLRDRAALSSPLRGLAPSGGHPSRLRELALAPRLARRTVRVERGATPPDGCPLFHTCSRQQPCGSSGRSAPCGLAQEPLGRAVKVADREVGLARTLPPPRVWRAGPASGPGASARRSQAARRTAASTQRSAGSHRRASFRRPVPGRVLAAARLECLLETRPVTTTPRRASLSRTTPNFRTTRRLSAPTPPKRF